MLLRRLTGADAADPAALHGDPAVMRRIDDGRPVPRAVVGHETLPALLREYRELPHGLGCLAAVERTRGTFPGWFSLRPAAGPGLDGGTEPGHRLHRAAWGRGYATEGARALVRSAFADLALDRVVATAMTVNTASRRVLEKAGLSLVRTFLEEWPEYIEGAEHGDVVYEITRDAWEREPRGLPSD